jgi:hypothetical protein
MELDQIDPNDLTSADIQAIAGDILSIIDNNVVSIAGSVVNPLSESVISLEDELAKIYKPMVRNGEKELIAIEKDLRELTQRLTTLAQSSFAALKGEVGTLQQRITKDAIDGKPNRIGRITPPHDVSGGSLPGSGRNQSGSIPGGRNEQSMARSMPLLPAPQIEPDQTDGGTATNNRQDGIASASIAGTMSELQREGMETTDWIDGNPIPSTLGISITSVQNGDGNGFPSPNFPAPNAPDGPIGDDGAKRPPKPNCPPGYVAQFLTLENRWHCVPGPPVPKPEPKPKPCYIPPPEEKGEIPPPFPSPTCDKPDLQCPPGNDWWWDPNQGIWVCTRKGEPPKPGDDIPAPSCEDVLSRVQFHIPLSCNQLPRGYVDTLEKCGIVLCEDGEAEVNDKAQTVKGEFIDALIRSIIMMGIIKW